MNPLSELLKKDTAESFREAAELSANMSFESLPLLKEIIKTEADPKIREKAVKIIGGIEESSVIPFLINVLEDPSFNVRRSAALILKILTGEDHYHSIYKSPIGQEFKRSFWYYMDFIPDHHKERSKAEIEKYLTGFASFFAELSRQWTYSTPDNPSYFNIHRKQGFAQREDGKALFKNFNYYTEKVLNAADAVLYLTGSLGRVIESPTDDEGEKGDILRCLRIALTSQFKLLEKGLGGFIASFHYLRSEFSLALPERNAAYLNSSSPDFTAGDENLKKTLLQGFIDYGELRTVENPDIERITSHLILLRKHISRFLSLCGEFMTDTPVCPENYLTVKKMAIEAHQCAIHNLTLLSCWCKDD